MNKIILILTTLLFPIQVLACNCGCGNNGCGNVNPSQPSWNTPSACTGNQDLNVKAKASETKLCTNVSTNKNKYNCGGNQKWKN